MVHLRVLYLDLPYDPEATLPLIKDAEHKISVPTHELGLLHGELVLDAAHAKACLVLSLCEPAKNLQDLCRAAADNGRPAQCDEGPLEGWLEGRYVLVVCA